MANIKRPPAHLEPIVGPTKPISPIRWQFIRKKIEGIFTVKLIGIAVNWALAMGQSHKKLEKRLG